MRRVVLFATVVGLLAGCGGPSTVTVTSTQTVTVTAPTTTPQQQQSVRVYFVRDGKVGPVSRMLDTVNQASLLAALAAGPTPPERAIGFDRGEANEKLAATVYTLSQLSPVRPVVVDGKSYRRSDFEQFTPAILVESPLPYEAVSSPLRLFGTANTFEATFEYDLLDPAGKVLTHHFVTATSGSGTRGTYDVKIPFEAPNGVGKLVVYEISAADGSKTNVVEIPLTLAR